VFKVVAPGVAAGVCGVNLRMHRIDSERWIVMMATDRPMCLVLAIALMYALPCELPAQIADSIHVGGTIVTMSQQLPVAEAVACRGDRIIAVGLERDIRKLADANTRVHDLSGKVMIPGLYAAHDHFPAVGRQGIVTADLNSPPIGAVASIADLLQALEGRAGGVSKGQWVTGRGYDDTLLKERRHPTRNDLDKVSTDHPIWITHTSGHLGVANSLALSIAGIDAKTHQPEGGRIQLDPTTGEPNGVIEASLGLVTRRIPAISAAEQLRCTQAAVEKYVRQGVTTAVVAAGGTSSVKHLKTAIEEGVLPFRVITMTSGGPYPEAREIVRKLNSPLLKTGAIKLLQDGSIQGYTGYLADPYFQSRNGDDAYRGYPLRSREALTQRVTQLHAEGFQMAIHGNGDEAIDDILHAYQAAQVKFPRSDARHRIEHAQTAREDQIDEMKRLGVAPSYFVGHVYYWGDRHRDLFLGPERAARISPLQSTIRRGIRFTIHDDTPVTPVDPLQLVWVSANRLTTDGKVLGPEQRISPMQALRAVTIDAAWQNFEEEFKGSIEEGKLADFVILDANPMATEVGGIREIKVLETIVGGKTIFLSTDQ
jgi:hypothetical protein